MKYQYINEKRLDQAYNNNLFYSYMQPLKRYMLIKIYATLIKVAPLSHSHVITITLIIITIIIQYINYNYNYNINNFN